MHTSATLMFRLKTWCKFSFVTVNSFTLKCALGAHFSAVCVTDSSLIKRWESVSEKSPVSPAHAGNTKSHTRQPPPTTANHRPVFVRRHPAKPISHYRKHASIPETCSPVMYHQIPFVYSTTCLLVRVNHIFCP